MRLSFNLCLLGILLFLNACKKDTVSTVSEATKSDKTTNQQFAKLSPSKSKVSFKNTLTETREFNFINYLYMYNGGGVSIADINNDGLEDIFFSANQVSNKLYLNKGNLTFQDVTSNANVGDALGWKNGTSMVDINSDGLIDIYVCKSGPYDPQYRANKLFINLGDGKFEDQAKSYGLDDQSYSVQSYFFDFDKDGDLDMYLVNHRVDFQYTFVFNPSQNNAIDNQTTDKLYRNDGGKFVDISKKAGIQNRTFGHSASIYDFNDDGWDDIYVCNDFLEGDNLWINQKNGTFKDQVYKHMDHISQYSMGSDVADINNDELFDFIAVDMVPEDHATSKQNMGTMSTEKFHVLREYGHHYQYMSNMVQLNRGNGVYSEIGNMLKMSKTDWSWAPLIADFDNDGFKDIFITNGIRRDMTDNDFKKNLEKRAKQGPMEVSDAQNLAPTRQIPNYMFKNNGDLKFKNAAIEWGLSDEINSNGSAYADLDNDGDLDLIINNIDNIALIYENKSSNKYLKFKLNGSDNNKEGIGTKIKVELDNGEIISTQNYKSRGYLSSVSAVQVIGVGNASKVKEVTVIWPDQKFETLSNLETNQVITLQYSNAKGSYKQNSKRENLIVKDGNSKLNKIDHIENDHDDFQNEILLPQKYSTLGPSLATGDINNDGIADIYMGGASGQAGKILLSNNSEFYPKEFADFTKDKNHEDTGALFIDIDNDNDLDLYVVSGGNEKESSNTIYSDRLYLNENGNFKKSTSKHTLAKNSGKVLLAADFDQDGDKDLFIGGRILPKSYPMPPSSIFLENNKGILTDRSDSFAKDLNDLGMITGAIATDFDKDGDTDILAVGEWMGLTLLENNKGSFTKKDLSSISGVGWWYSITEADLDKDGDNDYILGNLGLNNKFGANTDKPFHVFCSDFDDSGSLDIVLSKQTKSGDFLPLRGKECSSDQMPFINQKFPTYKSFASADLNDILGEEKLAQAKHFQATDFSSIILRNDGKNNFEKINLPSIAQFGPLLNSQVVDVNNDGHLDIIGVGNIYNAEVETVRYDASKGFVLIGDGAFNFTELKNHGFVTSGNTKDMAIIDHGKFKQIIVANNNGPLEVFRIN